MTLLVNETEHRFVCFSVAFGRFSGALTNETKSVRYKYWGFVESRFIRTHPIITRAKKILFVIIPRTSLYRGSLDRGSFVGIKLYLPGAVTIGNFCFVSFPAFTAKKHANLQLQADNLKHFWNASEKITLTHSFQILIWPDSKLRKVLKNVLEVHYTEHEMSDNFRIFILLWWLVRVDKVLG